MSEWNPSVIKNMDVASLRDLSNQLRSQLKHAIAQHGGHYGSSLGVVELTLSIHYIFDSPIDRIIWDTGHQAYAHKLLTGRSGLLLNLRQENGISGFPDPRESEHDAFGVGHASTAIGAALGIAQAQRDANWVVAVIGDAALAGGPALEALNLVHSYAGQNLCIVLNDNGYSISPTVGALASHRPGSYSRLVEAFNIDYIGPVNGHDLPTLISTLSLSKQMRKSCLIHVQTDKAHGDAAMIKQPLRGHFVSPPTSETQCVKSTPGKTMQRAMSDALSLKLRDNPRMRIISPGMTVGADIESLRNAWPDRVYDVGITEASAVTMAAGMALGGQLPVVHIYSTFLQRAFDQLIHDVHLQNAPMVVIIDRVGLAGEDGPTHHGIFDLAILAALELFEVYHIANIADVSGMLAQCLDNLNGPRVIRLSKGTGVTYGSSGESMLRIPLTRVLRSGGDINIVSHGRILSEVKEAVLALESEGIGCRVIEVIRLQPLPLDELIKYVDWRKPTLIVEENVFSGSVAGRTSSWRAAVAQGGLPIQSLCINQHKIPHMPIKSQWRAAGIDSLAIKNEAIKLLMSTKIQSMHRPSRELSALCASSMSERAL